MIRKEAIFLNITIAQNYTLSPFCKEGTQRHAGLYEYGVNKNR